MVPAIRRTLTEVDPGVALATVALAAVGLYGVLGSLAANRMLAALLFGVAPTDMPTLALERAYCSR